LLEAVINTYMRPSFYILSCILQHMESEQEAQKAIRSLNGHILNGNRLNVEVSCYLYDILNIIELGRIFVTNRKLTLYLIIRNYSVM